MKLKQYCAYQERCHLEVREKLYAFGLRKTDVETCISQLIEENYLNEERFAIQYAGGKFRVRQWGRMKIKFALKQKQVSDYCIKKALAAITEEDYNETLVKLAAKKWEAVSGSAIEKQAKLRNNLLQKGYENEYISRAIKELTRP